MVNKKGQEMSVTTLVLIVIGVILLVMLILGFSMGWSNLWGKINILGGGGGVETVIQACQIAATSDAASSYCDDFKQVTIAGVKQHVNCQYSDVASKLDKSLTCSAGNAEASAGRYCGRLYAAASNQSVYLNSDTWKNTLYNGKSCSKYLEESKVVDSAGKVLEFDQSIGILKVKP
jgi:hypothetical protein